MTITPQDYAAVLARSQSVAWNIDDVLPNDASFDMSQAFLPASMTGVIDGPQLAAGDRLLLDHIRAHGYLAIFGVVEEMILPFVLARIEERLTVDLDEVRALLQFAEEEAKHIALFRRFERTFRDGFRHNCDVIGPGSAVAEHVLSHSALGVGLFVLHIEWMTQRHYVALVHDESNIEPAFQRLLRMHWLEERQHARLDGFVVASLAASASPAQRMQAVADYAALLNWLDDALRTQVDFDIDALQRARGDALPPATREALRTAQHRSLQRLLITSGATHPRVVAAISEVHPSGRHALAMLPASNAA